MLMCSYGVSWDTKPRFLYLLPSPDYKSLLLGYSTIDWNVLQNLYPYVWAMSKLEYCIIHQLTSIEGLIRENYPVPLLPNSPC